MKHLKTYENFKVKEQADLARILYEKSIEIFQGLLYCNSASMVDYINVRDERVIYLMLKPWNRDKMDQRFTDKLKDEIKRNIPNELIKKIRPYDTYICIWLNLKSEAFKDFILEYDSKMKPILDEYIKYQDAEDLGLFYKESKKHLEIPIWEAVADGDLNALKEYKGDLNDKDDNGNTFLMYASCGDNQAVGNDQLNIVKYLIRHGADVNLQNEYDYTALMISINTKKINIAKYLIENAPNIDVNIESIDYPGKSDTALSLAILYDQLDIVKLLIEHGAKLTETELYSFSKDAKEEMEIDTDNIMDYFSSYEFQKTYFTFYPQSYEFIKDHFKIDPKIKEEFSDIIGAHDLGLFYNEK